MVRSTRKIAESNIYHIVSRGCGKQIIFEEDDDRNVFLRIVSIGLRTYSVEMFAWCLMDNHIHLLLHAPMKQISLFMQSINSKYAMYYNKKYERTGHLLQGRFISEPIYNESYLMSAVRYIHFNPQKAGICPMKHYRWSSYHEYLGSSHFITHEFVIEVFGGMKNFVAFHEDNGVYDPFIDLDRGRKRIDDASTIEIAQQVLGSRQLGTIAGLDKQLRDNALCSLKEANLSLRQIERLTGISKSIVGRAVREK